MRYIYPDLARQYNTYVRNAKIKCLREFRMDIGELLDMSEDQRTSEQAEFVSFYRHRLPVGDHDCVMNRICKRFEHEFDHYVISHPSPIEFNPSILKAGVEYPYSQYRAIAGLYSDYVKKLERFRQEPGVDATSDEYSAQKDFMLREMKAECITACTNPDQLCDVVVDVCYRSNSSKQFVWDVCGDEIIHNMLVRHDGLINYPAKDPDGDIEFGGMRFSMRQKEVQQ